MRGGAFRPRAVRDLSIPGARGVRVCYALPPLRAGPVRLAGWWPSFGSGFSHLQAARRASAEAIERACGVFQGTEARITAAYRTLGPGAIHPAECQLISERQRRGRPNRPRSPLTGIPPRFDERDPIEWTPVWSMTAERWKYLPTMSLYFKYPIRRARRYCPADSNGIAAGATRTEASLRGLLELVERDSVALWWYNRIRRPRVDLASSKDTGIERLLEFYRAAGREVWVIDLTSDIGIPVCAAISRRSGGREDLAFGFGASLQRVDAARHAMLEMAQVLAVRHAGGRGGSGTAAFESWRRGATAAGTHHLRPSRAPSRDKGGTAGDAENAGRALARVMSAIETRGLEVLSCDLSRAGAPLSVMRMVAPGLRHMWPRLAAGRLYRAPVQAGWSRRMLHENQLNPVPLLL